MEIIKNWKGLEGYIGKNGRWRPASGAELRVERRILVKQLIILDELIKKKTKQEDKRKK